MKAFPGDYIRKDGAVVRIDYSRDELDHVVHYTSDGGCIGDDEVTDVLLESEVV